MAAITVLSDISTTPMAGLRMGVLPVASAGAEKCDGGSKYKVFYVFITLFQEAT